jgi:hypothetical protein
VETKYQRNDISGENFSNEKTKLAQWEEACLTFAMSSKIEAQLEDQNCDMIKTEHGTNIGLIKNETECTSRLITYR